MFNWDLRSHKLKTIMDTIPQNHNLKAQLLTLAEELRDLGHARGPIVSNLHAFGSHLLECETAVEFELLMAALA